MKKGILIVSFAFVLVGLFAWTMQPEEAESGDTIVLTDENFEELVLNSELPVLVDFWAVWCGPCKAVAPIMKEFSSTYKGKMVVGKLDIDKSQQIPQRYKIRSIPTLLLFKNGEIVETIVGSQSKSKIEAKIKPHL